MRHPGCCCGRARNLFRAPVREKSARAAGLHRRNRELAADQGAGIEIIVARSFAELVQIDTAMRIAGKCEAAAGVEQGLEAQFELRRGGIRHLECLRTALPVARYWTQQAQPY